MNKIYQREIIKQSSKFRPKSNYTSYPPYHSGPFIEEYFYNYYINNNIKTDRIYLSIFWTNINNNYQYNGDKKIKFEDYLSSLDNNYKYFTVCQHEDLTDSPKLNMTPTEESLKKLPTDILIFSGSGKITDKYKSNNIICIPHVVSPISDPILNKKRDIFCSFVGAKTHPVRQELYDIYKDDEDFYFNMEEWTIKINENKEMEFKDIAERSIFSLCPRGNGPTSYRLWEVMQLGSIPVYIYDNKWVPWEDEINWDDICIFIHVDEISCLKTYLKNISNERINEIRNNINLIYDKYFTLEKVCETIIRKINNE